MSDISSSQIPRLWQQCSEGNYHEPLQFLSKQGAGAADRMAVDLLLYSEAHLLHHQNLTADIWVRLVRAKLINPAALDARLVNRMKNYAYTAQNVTSMHQYITSRWEEHWWKSLNFTQVSCLGHRIWVSSADNRVCDSPDDRV